MGDFYDIHLQAVVFAESKEDALKLFSRHIKALQSGMIGPNQPLPVDIVEFKLSAKEAASTSLTCLAGSCEE